MSDQHRQASKLKVSTLNDNNNDDDISQSTDYQNEAFENDIPDISDFDHQRPKSSYSIASKTSNASRSSINCISGSIKCPNGRLGQFFSYKEGSLDSCLNDAKTLVNAEADGNIIDHWLLIEIDHWDLHREKFLLLCDKSLFIISYDFIKNTRRNFKKVTLANINSVSYGNLKYTSNSLMGKYLYGAVRIKWGEAKLIDNWNPFSKNIPFLVLTSHHILYHDNEKETATFNCDDFITTLDLAISKLNLSQKPEFKEEPIEIKSYANLVSVLYNQNWVGFNLDRNGVNF